MTNASRTAEFLLPQTLMSISPTDPGRLGIGVISVAEGVVRDVLRKCRSTGGSGHGGPAFLEALCISGSGFGVPL